MGGTLMSKAHAVVDTLDYRRQEGTLLSKVFPANGHLDDKGCKV